MTPRNLHRWMAAAALAGTAACATDGPLTPDVTPRPVSRSLDTPAGAQPAASPVFLRGTAFSVPRGAVLMVVDGRVLTEAELGQVDPATIESVQLVKPAAAVPAYGAAARNGAILIRTRAPHPAPRPGRRE
jgi:outer membrane receptor protein involved in Fe transport